MANVQLYFKLKGYIFPHVETEELYLGKIRFHLLLGHPLFFFRFLSNAFSDFGSVGRKRKKKNKNKIEKKSGARWPGTSA